MKNYLKNLPDYSKLEQKQTNYSHHPVRLREHPTPKPFYGVMHDYGPKNTPAVPAPRHQHVPLSKSNSISAIVNSKRNLGQSIEKEALTSEKSKISRSTSSTAIPPKENSDLIGFMKPSSIMNMFKKFGSHSNSVSHPKPPIMNGSVNNFRNAQPDNRSQPQDMRSQPQDIRSAPQNVPQDPNKAFAENKTPKSISDFWNENLNQRNASNKKVGWNYQKIVQQQPMQPQQQHIAKKFEPADPQAVAKANKKIARDNYIQQTSFNFKNHPKSQSISHFSKQMTESPKLQRSSRATFESSQEQKLLKSSSNSHIYMNKDDPNYYKNLHKITKSLENATNLINKQPSYKQAVPMSGLVNSPPFYPSSAPISFYPPVSYKTAHEMLARSGSKSNIPICYKNPLSKSSSNTAMVTNSNGTAAGFYSVPDPLIWQAVPLPHNINKSYSSSCIYAKTLNQPTHLSKNNDIFAKYKPIVSDDEESGSDDDDDTSKHSNVSKSSHSRLPFKSQNYPPFTQINCTPIPIHGNLPSAFGLKSSAACFDASGKTQEDEKPPDVVKSLQPSSGAKNAVVNSNKPLQMTSSSTAAAPVARGSCNKVSANTCNQFTRQFTPNSANSFFYNFLNPMTASHSQMHLQQQNEGVGSYTPYTKYLSDRKYFDVATSDGNNELRPKPDQRRVSKIPTLAGGGVEQQPAFSNVAPTMLAKEKEFQPPVFVPTTVEPSVSVVPAEILSAFDPFYTPDDPPSGSGSNKLQELLATVTSEWNSEGIALENATTTRKVKDHHCDHQHRAKQPPHEVENAASLTLAALLRPNDSYYLLQLIFFRLILRLTFVMYWHNPADLLTRFLVNERDIVAPPVRGPACHRLSQHRRKDDFSLPNALISIEPTH